MHKLLALGSALACSITLVACGGQGDDAGNSSGGGNPSAGASGESATTPMSLLSNLAMGRRTSASTTDPVISTTSTTQSVILAKVEVAQSHVIAPQGRVLQSPNDITNNRIHRLTLVADRAALLMLRPQGTVSGLVVRTRLADGSILGPLTLNPPGKLPTTDGGRAAYASDAYSVLLPAAWVKPGASLEVGQSDFSAPTKVALTVTPASSLTQITVPIYLFGARAASSVVTDFSMRNFRTGDYPLDQEYRERLPVARFEQTTSAPLTFDQLVLPPRNDDTFCYPAMPVSSWTEMKALGGDPLAGMLRVMHDLRSRTANRDDDMVSGYYGFLQTMKNGLQVAINLGGLGGAGAGVTGADDSPFTIYSGIFQHEMGHAYGLSHALTAAAEGDYPYPLGTKSGSSWGFDSYRNQLFSTLQYPGQTCEDRMVNGVCYEATPMSDGSAERDATLYRWTWFSDYEAALMQENFLDKAVRDDAFAGGYKRWNLSKGVYEALDIYARARIGTDVLKPAQSIQTVIGTISHFNLSPTASRIYVTPTWTGYQPRQFDPTVQADLDLINTTQPGGWNGDYCQETGCDYTMVATYADGSVVRVLLPVGYHNYGGDTSTTINASAQDVLSEDNLATYAVNLPTGHGGLSRIQVFKTPFGSQWMAKYTAIPAAALGTSTYPLVNEWTPADNFTGGKGAAGTTQFNSSACRAGATVK